MEQNWETISSCCPGLSAIVADIRYSTLRASYSLIELDMRKSSLNESEPAIYEPVAITRQLDRRQRKASIKEAKKSEEK